MASEERQRENRVTFARGFDVWIMAIDGTWRRECVMKDASEVGAQLITKNSIRGLNLKEFFLLLSTTGLAFRRCELAWVNGDQLGVNFLRLGKKVVRPADRPD
jgi:hypothetical protein